MTAPDLAYAFTAGVLVWPVGLLTASVITDIRERPMRQTCPCGRSFAGPYGWTLEVPMRLHQKIKHGWRILGTITAEQRRAVR